MYLYKCIITLVGAFFILKGTNIHSYFKITFYHWNSIRNWYCTANFRADSDARNIEDKAVDAAEEDCPLPNVKIIGCEAVTSEQDKTCLEIKFPSGIVEYAVLDEDAKDSPDFDMIKRGQILSGPLYKSVGESATAAYPEMIENSRVSMTRRSSQNSEVFIIT